MAEGTSRQRPPLGLPQGSVRALVALCIVSVVVVETWRQHDLPVVLAETLLVVLAHYFTSRRLLRLSPDLRQRLEAEGALHAEPHPLWLPRHTVRVLIVLAFVGLAAALWWHDRLWHSATLATIGLVLAYLLGAMTNALLERWSRRRPARQATRRRWEDVKALAVLIAAGLLAAGFLADRPDLLPTWFRNTTFGLVLFYFGSR